MYYANVGQVLVEMFSNRSKLLNNLIFGFAKMFSSIETEMYLFIICSAVLGNTHVC